MILNRIFTDREFGPIMVRKNSRSRSISIRVRASEGRTGCRISVTVPYSRTLQDGIDYLNTRRDWVREALRKQEKVNAGAQIHDGFVMRTLLSQIVFRPSGEVSPVLPSAAPAGKLSFRIRTSVIDNPQDSGRLWLSLDNPTHIRIIEVPAGFQLPSLAQVNDGVDPSSVIPQKALRDVLAEVLREEAKILLPQKLSYFSDQYGFHFHKVTLSQQYPSSHRPRLARCHEIPRLDRQSRCFGFFSSIHILKFLPPLQTLLLPSVHDSSERGPQPRNQQMAPAVMS